MEEVYLGGECGEFSFGRIKFKMFIGYSSEDIKG